MERTNKYCSHGHNAHSPKAGPRAQPIESIKNHIKSRHQFANEMRIAFGAENKKISTKRSFCKKLTPSAIFLYGAGNGDRTRDLSLGKAALYH